MIVHLLRGGTIRAVDEYEVQDQTLPEFWCEPNSIVLPCEFVTEAFFASCTACLEARSRAASAVKPEAPKENPWG